jgi:two-component system, cell cycle sensor histidine kinase and response regulator CckA
MTANRILIVEDERIVAKDLELRLQSLGYTITGSVANGRDAIRLAGEFHPDLVMMDIRIQGDIDGIAAAECIRKEFFIPVIYLTAHSDDETLRRAQVTEPYGYLLKPFQERELRTVIEMGLYKHQADAKLRSSERRFATTLSSIGDGVIATDRLANVTFLNPVAQQLTGWDQKEAVGKTLSEIFVICNETTRETVPNPVDRVLREGIVVGLANHTVLTARDGSEVPIDDCAAPILDDLGKTDGAVLVFRDISELRREEQAKTLLDEKFREASKIEAIGRLAGGVAHDFNNLLTVINGHADLLLMEKNRSDPDWESLSAIQDAGDRAARLTQQLLAFSRRSMIEPKVLDLNSLVFESAKLLRRLIGEDVSLGLSLSPDLHSIKADQGQIEQIIINLAVNSRDAMTHGGKLSISTRNVVISHHQQNDYPELAPGNFVELCVTDTGTGMSEEVKAKIFEPFFTTKGVGKGTGLGLAVVHGIVKQGGGHITVSTQIGQGTSFLLLFPSTENHVSATVEHAQLPPRGLETILLVEDEELVRNIARIALDVQGYLVLSAQSTADAIRIAEEHDGRIDLLVTDVVMPDMGGRMLASVVKTQRPGIRVLYMSGYTDETVFQEGKIDSSEAFIQKPFSPLGLARKVRGILDGK